MSRSAAEAPGEDRRGRNRLRLVLLSVLALLLQLPFALVLSLNDGVSSVGAVTRIGVAVVSPLVFLFAQRWPGPRVAILAALTLLDLLVWAASFSLIIYSAEPGGGGVLRAAGPDAVGMRPAPGYTPGQEPGTGDGWNEGGLGGGPGSGGPGDWAQHLGGPDVTPFYAAFLFALVAAMARGRWVWAVASAGGLWAGALLLDPLFSIGWPVWRVVMATIGLVAALGIGALLRHRAESARAAAERVERRHAEAAAAERIRIARELHDVLGHSLSQINVQAGVGEHLLDRDPDQARRALAAIKEISSNGLDEVRAVLQTMRSAPLVPVLGLDDLPALIESMTGGPDIRLVDRRDEDGQSGISRAADAAGYRIVQEALTNVVRHADASAATVEISYQGSFVQITIGDDGRGIGDDGRDSDRKGGGILGMRERAELLGGSFTITSGEHGGTTVIARLPRSHPGAAHPPMESRST